MTLDLLLVRLKTEGATFEVLDALEEEVRRYGGITQRFDLASVMERSGAAEVLIVELVKEIRSLKKLHSTQEVVMPDPGGSK